MKRVKVYQCFHSKETIPLSKYISETRPPILCGASLDWRHKDVDYSNVPYIIYDNDGENISDENTMYSELTGYYWAWKNEKEADIVGIEHYERHFIKPNRDIGNYITSEDLISPEEIIERLSSADFIVPVPEILSEMSIYDLYKHYFPDMTEEMIKWMKAYFILIKKRHYLEAMYAYLSKNILYRGNLLITTKGEFNRYCKEMFNMIDFLKGVMWAAPGSRTWGYISEIFPAIYLIANEKSFCEVDTCTDELTDPRNGKPIYLTYNKVKQPFHKNPYDQINYFKSIKLDI